MGQGRSPTFPRHLLSLYDIHILGQLKSALPLFELQALERIRREGLLLTLL